MGVAGYGNRAGNFGGALGAAYGVTDAKRCANATQDVEVWRSRIGKKAYPKAEAKMKAAQVLKKTYCTALEDVANGPELPMDPSGSVGAGGMPAGLPGSPLAWGVGAVAALGLLWWSTS